MPNLKKSLYVQFARIGKALASPHRLELLDLLGQGPRPVEDLARETGLPFANVSQHLQTLRRARLVDAEKRGLFVTYRLADPTVDALFRSLRSMAEARLVEVERIAARYLGGRKGMEPVDREKLLEKVRDGSVTVLDVRPAAEYEAGHLPGALSIPLRELGSRLAEVPKHRTVVAYCRGPYCVMAVEAVRRLKRKGFRALRMEEGVAEWKARGWEVVSGGSAVGTNKLREGKE